MNGIYQKYKNFFLRSKRFRFPQSTYSLKKRIYKYSAVLILILLLSAVSMCYLFTHILLNTTYNNISKTVQVNNENVKRNLSGVESCMYKYTLNNTDVGLLTTLKDPKSVPLYQIRVNMLFSNTLNYLSDVDGLYLYAPRTDSYVSSFSVGATSECNSYIKKLLRTETRNNQDSSLNLKQWYFVKLEDHTYLVRIIKTEYSYMGGWTRIDTLTAAFEQSKEFQPSFYYVSESGDIISPTDTPVNWSYDKWNSKTRAYHLITDNNGVKYLGIKNQLDFCDYDLVTLMPIQTISSSLSSVYRIFILIFAVLICLVGLLVISITKFLGKPLNTLQSIHLKYKENTFKIEQQEDRERCEEVLDITSSLFSLLDEISALKINVYEERILKTEFELQFLKNQVAPHFLINCLSTINSLQKMENGSALTQKMISTLSDHLRYTLSTRTTVPLREELKYVENYLELTDLRFPGSLSYQIVTDPGVENASVFPLLILMLTENTMKYNMIMGEALAVTITIRLISGDDLPRIHITHIDSGSGFPAEQAELFNHPELLKKRTETGHGLGIYNTIKRLSLVYDHSATIYFSNEPGLGARVDIDLPYIAF